eukprot:10123529-Alexandrium_andersonii.AAC.1
MARRFWRVGSCKPSQCSACECGSVELVWTCRHVARGEGHVLGRREMRHAGQQCEHRVVEHITVMSAET